MARWRLMNPHYLNVPGTEWEYTEVSRATGKQARVRYPVGLFLDPNDPNDHNHPGEVIVAHDKTGHRNDIVFIGPPTPDMEPIDDEAEKITSEWRPKWVRPMSEDALPGYGDYSQSLLKNFEQELNNAINRVDGKKNISISSSEFELLKKQVADLARQNEQLKAKVAVGK